MARLLEVEGAAVSFGGRSLFRPVNLTLEPGARLVLSGPSGTGKSVLLRAIAGLEPLSAGSVRLGGVERAAIPAARFRRRCLYLAQTPGRLPGTLRENLERVRALRENAGRCLPWEALQALLARVGLAGRESEPVERLSGGEAQRLALVRALQLEPEVLLADEPSANLDEHAARTVEALLCEWVAGPAARALLWVGHDHSAVERLQAERYALEPDRA